VTKPGRASACQHTVPPHSPQNLEPRRAAAPTDPDILPALPLDRHRVQGEPRLRSEHAACALLAREAMADGDAHRLAAGANN